MEQKDIDIYEILKGMPDGTPLYTPMCGNVEFTSVAADKEKMEAIWTEDKNGEYSFDKHGKWMIERASDWRKENPEKVKGYNDKQKKLRRIEAERKKLERTNLKVKASIFRDPKAAEHFMWLAERVKKKKEQSLNHRK